MSSQLQASYHIPRKSNGASRYDTSRLLDGMKGLRQHRELFVGNIPPGTSEMRLIQFLNGAMRLANLCQQHEPHILKCRVHHTGMYAFIELSNIEAANQALNLTGIPFLGATLKVSRPFKYTGPHVPSKTWQELTGTQLPDNAILDASADEGSSPPVRPIRHSLKRPLEVEALTHEVHTAAELDAFSTMSDDEQLFATIPDDETMPATTVLDAPTATVVTELSLNTQASDVSSSSLSSVEIAEDAVDCSRPTKKQRYVSKSGKSKETGKLCIRIKLATDNITSISQSSSESTYRPPPTTLASLRMVESETVSTDVHQIEAPAMTRAQ